MVPAQRNAEKVFSIGIDKLYSEIRFSFTFRKFYASSEEVEENMALNTLGTIIHETLKVLYEPFIAKFIVKLIF
jgi:hypothetical protein